MKKDIEYKIKRYLYENYQDKTDSQMAEELEVARSTVVRWRNTLGLQKRKKQKGEETDILEKFEETSSVDVKSMTQKQKREYFLKKLRNNPRYQITKGLLTAEELNFYEAKYIEYSTSPEIETLTAYEEDDLHELTMTQISKMRIQRMEYDEVANGDPVPDVSRNTKDKDETILKLKKSLDLERSQRLRRQEDSATNFINLVKEFNNAKIRNVVGREANAFNAYGDECLNKMIEDGNAYGIEEIDVSKYYDGGKNGGRKKEEEYKEKKEKAEKKNSEEIEKDMGEKEAQE